MYQPYTLNSKPDLVPQHSIENTAIPVHVWRTTYFNYHIMGFVRLSQLAYPIHCLAWVYKKLPRIIWHAITSIDVPDHITMAISTYYKHTHTHLAAKDRRM